MRVLMLAQVVVYPPDAGAKAKTLEVLRHLSARHEVTFCGFARNAREQRSANELLGLCRRVVTVPLHRSRRDDVCALMRSLATGDSFLLRRDDKPAMHSAVRRLLDEERIEVIHVDQVTMMRFVPPDWPGIVIFDAHNALWRVVARLRHGARNPAMRSLLGREVRLLRHIEGAACLRAHVALAVSEPDRKALQEIASPTCRIEVAPICVDTKRFRSIREKRGPHSDRLLTLGTMFWPPNSEGVIWWLEEGYAHFRELCPSATYDIVGARPPNRLRRIARRHARVRVHGYVDDVTPFCMAAGAMAVPLLSGGGTRVKILEAMAMGVPVVSTTMGAEGLPVQSGEHLLLADSPVAFAQACSAVLRDWELAQRLAQNAYQMLLARYDVGCGLRALDFAYEHVLEQGVKLCASHS